MSDMAVRPGAELPQHEEQPVPDVHLEETTRRVQHMLRLILFKRYVLANILTVSSLVLLAIANYFPSYYEPTSYSLIALSSWNGAMGTLGTLTAYSLIGHTCYLQEVLKRGGYFIAIFRLTIAAPLFCTVLSLVYLVSGLHTAFMLGSFAYCALGVLFLVAYAALMGVFLKTAFLK
ncbi:hypothetical protein M405DRAFT_881234 [Rhizopogon salebrosus TDB-379]|nr:hypothetical protein M405DRAFT_881234 [Rhizopogon salebrosus TDB-379]